MSYRNYMEQIVQEGLNQLLNERTDICTCEQCKTEMITYALNNLPPKYVSSHKGEIYTKVDEMNTQLNADILKVLVKAVNQISENPRHKK